MKTTLRIALFAAILAAMPACNAQKRAERRVRRAVADCPELVQMKAHPIEGTATAPAFADAATLPWAAVARCDTLYAATEHGTVVVSLRQSDSALRVGFVAAPRTIRWHDTVRYPQVVIPPAEPSTGSGTGHSPFWSGLALWVWGVGLGMVLCSWLLRNALKNKR